MGAAIPYTFQFENLNDPHLWDADVATAAAAGVGFDFAGLGENIGGGIFCVYSKTELTDEQLADLCTALGVAPPAVVEGEEPEQSPEDWLAERGYTIKRPDNSCIQVLDGDEVIATAYEARADYSMAAAVDAVKRALG